MLTFVVAFSRTARPLPREVVERLLSGRTDDLTHEPEAVLRWLPAHRATCFMGWQTGADAFEAGSHWAETSDGLTAFAGWPRPARGSWSPGAWASQLAEQITQRSPASIRDDHRGTYSVLHLAAGGGRRSWLTSDVWGTGLVYLAWHDHALVVSNNPVLARKIAAGEQAVTPDVDAMGWLPYFGLIGDARTSVTGAEVLDPDHHIVHSPEVGVRIVTQRPRWQDVAHVEGGELDALIDDAAEELVNNVRTIARLPVPTRHLNLSGGKDSRLVLAAIVAAGALQDFRLRTFGLEQAPDVLVARLLGEELDVDVAYTAPSALTMTVSTFERRVRQHQFQTWGMFGTWDLRGHVSTTPDLVVTGLFGELMRSHYQHYARGKKLQQKDEVLEFFRSDMPFNPAGLVRQDVAAGYLAGVLQWGETQVEAGARPDDLPDLFYMTRRLRRWYGSAEGVAFRNPVAHPLDAPTAVMAAFAAGYERRKSDYVHFELMRRLHPPLAKLPFAEDSWASSNYGELADAQEYAAIEPIRGSTPAPTVWQDERWPDLHRVMLQEFSSGDSPLLSLLDRERLAAVTTAARSLNRSGQVTLFATYGAALWSKGETEPLRYPRSRARLHRGAQAPLDDVLLLTGPPQHMLSELAATLDGSHIRHTDPVRGPCDADVASLCDEFLATAGGDLLNPPPADRLAEAAPQFVDRATRLAAERGGVVIDVALARTYPLWRQVAHKVETVISVPPPPAVTSDTTAGPSELRRQVWVSSLLSATTIPDAQLVVEPTPDDGRSWLLSWQRSRELAIVGASTIADGHDALEEAYSSIVRGDHTLGLAALMEHARRHGATRQPARDPELVYELAALQRLLQRIALTVDGTQVFEEEALFRKILERQGGAGMLRASDPPPAVRPASEHAAAWTPFAATLHATVRNPELGSTGRAQGAYIQIGLSVSCIWDFFFDGAEVDPGAGFYEVEVPLEHTGAMGSPSGGGYLTIPGAGEWPVAVTHVRHQRFRILPPLGRYASDTHPAPCVAGSRIRLHMTYPARAQRR